MSTTMTIEVPVFFQPVGRSGRKALRPREEKPALPPGRMPGVARLMALALRFDELIRTGQVAHYSALASLGQVTRARICQILNLTIWRPTSRKRCCFCRRRYAAAIGSSSPT